MNENQNSCITIHQNNQSPKQSKNLFIFLPWEKLDKYIRNFGIPYEKYLFNNKKICHNNLLFNRQVLFYKYLRRITIYTYRKIM